MLGPIELWAEVRAGPSTVEVSELLVGLLPMALLPLHVVLVAELLADLVDFALQAETLKTELLEVRFAVQLAAELFGLLAGLTEVQA